MMSIRAILLFSVVLGIASTARAQDLPKEVKELVAAVKAIKGVTEVQAGKTYLPDIKAADLTLPGPYADLPIAAIRRTKGGLKNEQLVSIDFNVQRDEAGLKALEFLSWWVRDESRGGENMQIRSIGLPPMAGN